MTLSTSLSDNGRSPGSGAVCNKASRSSTKSTCPESSSSKAENAERSSWAGDSAESRVAREFKNAGREVVCGDEGGKKAVTSEVFAGRPGRTLIS